MKDIVYPAGILLMSILGILASPLILAVLLIVMPVRWAIRKAQIHPVKSDELASI